MIYKSKNHIRFDRENNILYEVINDNGVEKSIPLFIYEQYFPNWKNLKKEAIDYLKRYMEINQGLWKFYKKPILENEQLSLF